MKEHWNYRVLKTTLSDGTMSYDVHEVFYDVDAKGNRLWTTFSVALKGQTQQEIRNDLDLQKQAFARPILIVEDDEIVGEEQWD